MAVPTELASPLAPGSADVSSAGCPGSEPGSLLVLQAPSIREHPPQAEFECFSRFSLSFGPPLRLDQDR